MPTVTDIQFNITPVEEYEYEGIPILVKREDLCVNPPMPPLAKIRGIYGYIKRRSAKYQTFGILDTRVSKSGLGVAGICNALGLNCRYYVPKRLSEWDTFTDWQVTARDILNAKLIQIQATRLTIMHSRAKKDCRRAGGIMLPVGLPFPETAYAVADIIVPEDRENYTGTIIVPTGTGTILSGIICGLMKLDIIPDRIIGVSAGRLKERQNKIVWHNTNVFLDRYPADLIDEKRALLYSLLDRLHIYNSDYDYYYEPDTPDNLWDMHMTYEWKAWEWLKGNIHDLKLPILFWNIGT